MTIRVVVADDQEIVRAGFSSLLDTQADFTVVGGAATEWRHSGSAASSNQTSY